MSPFKNPEELKAFLSGPNYIDIETLKDLWYQSVRYWSFKDIQRGKQLISRYADKVFTT